MLGLPKGEVFLVPWNEQWEEEYLREREDIKRKIGGYVIVYHHIGSTAVKSLSAKPIIDVSSCKSAGDPSPVRDDIFIAKPVPANGLSPVGTKYYFAMSFNMYFSLYDISNRCNNSIILL